VKGSGSHGVVVSCSAFAASTERVTPLRSGPLLFLAMPGLPALCERAQHCQKLALFWSRLVARTVMLNADLK